MMGLDKICVDSSIYFLILTSAVFLVTEQHNTGEKFSDSNWCQIELRKHTKPNFSVALISGPFKWT